MITRCWALTLFALAATAQSVGAVSLDPRGTGQVLIFPYYTVNGGNQTLVTIGSYDSSHGKALRVRFVEGRNGREVYSFNLYLARSDVWTGALFSLNASGQANLVSGDASCTLPTINAPSVPPMLPDGRHYEPFSNISYAGANRDAGTTDLSRTREGYVEVIEMGSVNYGSPTDQAVMQTPPNCVFLANAWTAGGFWTQNPKTDLANPTGGLFGSIAIVNVAAGTMLAYNADALEEFRQDPLDMPRGSSSSVVLHTLKTDPHPTLADALTDPVTQRASASVVIDGRQLRLEYPVGRAIDAVSAVMMVTGLSNEYTIDPQMGAQTEWIQTFPTRRFYNDQALVGNTAIAPFANVYPQTGAEADVFFCEGNTYDPVDREHRIGVRGVHIDVVNGFANCYTVNTIPLNQSDQISAESASWLHSSLTATLVDGAPADFAFRAGWMRIAFRSPVISFPAPKMRATIDGKQLVGLPALGFVATNYVNSNVVPGVLANYSGIFPHRSSASCVQNGLPCQ
jgi:hypothetical protein